MTSRKSWPRFAPRSFSLAVLPLLCSLGSAPVGQEGVSAPPQDPSADDANLNVAEQEVQPSEATAAEPELVRYHVLDDARVLLDDWRASGLLEPIELGPSHGGRELFAVQFGGAGPRPLSDRSTIFLVGGIDGISMSGSETVIALVGDLLKAVDRLPSEISFVAIPWANPDGLAHWEASGCGGGRNDRAIDDDRDGRVDEDGAEDIDGDGVVLEMLIEDHRGAWAYGPDGRILLPARQGQAPRFRRTREGEDSDGDGRYNEDEKGGVVIDHNFPVHWRGPWSGVASGVWPLSEEATRSLVDLARRRHCAVFLAFQGNHGTLASPGGVETARSFVQPSDDPAYRFLLESFRETTGREQPSLPTQRQACGSDRSGTAVDWFYAALGALAAEIAVWGPWLPVSEEGEGGPLLPGSSELAWARFFDETRGGMGFVNWQPLDLEGGQKALIGGWARNTRFNPEPQALGELSRGMDEFCIALANAMPKLQFEVVSRDRREGVGHLKARVRNLAILPSGVGPGDPSFGTTVTLLLPTGVELLAGEETVSLGHIPGEGTSEVFSWLFLAPEGTLFRFRVESPWSPPVEFEERW